MKKLSLRTENAVSSFDIPVEFVDSYLAEAPELSLKLYLYLLRSMLDPSVLLSVRDMADRFDVTPNKVTLALHYWVEKGLLSLGYSDGELSDIMLLPVRKVAHSSEREVPAKLSARPVQEVTVSSAPAPSVPAPAPASPVFDIGALFDDADFTEILSLAEYYLKKPVNSAMRDAIATAYLTLEKKADVVEYLIEYCIDRGGSSPQYIKTVAGSWKDEGLTSVEAIRAKNAARNKTVYGIMSAFGIRNREPGETEMKFISEWTADFDLPIVLEACRRTLDTLHAPDFKYANGILKSWKDAGASTMEEIRVLDEQHHSGKAAKGVRPAPVKKTSFHNFPERHTDYDALFAPRNEKEKRGAI